MPRLDGPPRRTAALLVLVTALSGALWGCGGTLPPPKRRVLESDVSGWHFRRYQHVVDIEVFLDDNPAKAHTASYLRDAAEKRGQLTDVDVVSAFVTEYARPEGVGEALIKFTRRLAREGGYTVDERVRGGQRVLEVRGHGEAWAFWSSGKYVVKVGGRGHAKIPEAVVEAYGARYPSKVQRGALDGQ